MWCDLNWIVLIMGWCDPSEQKYSILTCDNRKVMIWKSKYEKVFCSEIFFWNYHSKGWPLMEPKVALHKQALIYHHHYN
jgi:hypothetical protein